MQEIFEAAEFVARVRRRVRRPCMLDAAAGHGLAGLMLAAVEQEVVRSDTTSTRTACFADM